MGLAPALLFAQKNGGFSAGFVIRPAPRVACSFGPFVPYAYFPIGDYATPYSYGQPYAQSHEPLSNYWWTGPYPPTDPRQEGYNPSGGYPTGTVLTLILETSPAKSRVILNGVFVGTADSLAPIQLPFGDHMLRVEAPNYEPSETLLRVERATVQTLQVRLTPLPQRSASKPKT